MRRRRRRARARGSEGEEEGAQWCVMAREPQSIESIGPDVPLRLDVAAEIAFPLGGMTASGLRSEARRGRLVIERIANKDFTTLRHIEHMREQCRAEAKAHDSGSNQADGGRTEKSSNRRYGSSATAQSNGALDAARAKLKRLKEDSETTSTPNPPSASATVTPLPSPSRT